MEDFRIVAVVQFNDREAYILNRMPDLKYRKEGSLLIGEDNGFYSTLRNEGGSRAFGGRKFDIPMQDGSITKATGQYYAVGTKIEGVDIEYLTLGTIEGLKECYVMSGGAGDAKLMKKLRSEYTGCVYPYRDYEKVIKFDDMRSKYIQKNIDLLKINSIIIKNAHNLKKEVKTLKNIIKEGKDNT